jgi:integrase
MERIPRSSRDEFCQKIKPQKKSIYIRDSQVKGVVLRVMPAGSKSWIFCYSVKEGDKWRERRKGLGPFRQGRNDVAGLTVPAARSLVQDMKHGVKHEGADPIDDKKKLVEERAKEKAGRVVIKNLFERWASTDLINRKDNGEEARRMMQKDVIPFIGHINIKEVRKGDILEVIDKLLQRGVNRMAKVVFSLIRQMFRFAVVRDLLEADPTALVSKKSIGGSNVARERVLHEDELKELANKLLQANMEETSVIAIWVSLATCCRIGEFLRAKWSHIDWEKKIWRIPPEHSKNQKEHNVFLSEFPLKHLRRLEEMTGAKEWFFPASRKNSHICPKTVTKQIADRQRNSQPYSNRSKQTITLTLSRGIWKPHDLRRTGATFMTSLGVLPEVAERCLNHTEENRVKRTYQRHTYEVEMQQAWIKLGAYLEDLIDSATKENK